MPETIAVIGKNYGDEGKGLAVHMLAAQAPSLVIRHNGGAQAGHTAEGRFGRFVFHQLGSGSPDGADTLLSDTFLVDLYQLIRETDSYRSLTGRSPRVYADPAALISCPDDVLINMALESARGSRRHGSCGMGIYEAQLRAESGAGLTLAEVRNHSADSLFHRLTDIRSSCTSRRLAETGLTVAQLGEYGELLRDEALLRGMSEAMIRGLDRLILKTPERPWLCQYPRVIFEGAQGLLLDAEYGPGQPHVTASRTGLTHPAAFCRKHKLPLQRALYVTRSYVTRHGAGPLPCECGRKSLGRIADDATNRPNPWQGSLRYARHPGAADFLSPVADDLRAANAAPQAELLVTHLNETDGRVVFASAAIPANTLINDLNTASDGRCLFRRCWQSDRPDGVSHSAEL